MIHSSTKLDGVRPWARANASGFSRVGRVRTKRAGHGECCAADLDSPCSVISRKGSDPREKYLGAAVRFEVPWWPKCMTAESRTGARVKAKPVARARGWLDLPMTTICTRRGRAEIPAKGNRKNGLLAGPLRVTFASDYWHTICGRQVPAAFEAAMATVFKKRDARRSASECVGPPRGQVFLASPWLAFVGPAVSWPCARQRKRFFLRQPFRRLRRARPKLSGW